jgi:formylglycine-generating enzyme required for sulfatase activity
MSIAVRCPSCARTLSVSDQLVGQRVKCPGSAAPITVRDPREGGRGQVARQLGVTPAGAGRSGAPKWLIITTGSVGLVTAVFIAATKFYEVRKARAEAAKAEREVEHRAPDAQQPPTPAPAPAPRRDAGRTQAETPQEVLLHPEDRPVHYTLAPAVAMAFCRIPPGNARVGSPTGEAQREGDETERDFSTRGFWLGKFEVTQAEWLAVMAHNPSTHDGRKAGPVFGADTSRFPVENVSWEDVHLFLDSVNGRRDAERAFGVPGVFCLPTEDEWEYACRGGKGNAEPFYFGRVLNGRQANSDGTRPYGTAAPGPKLGRPTAVGSYAAEYPHPWGLCDMHGNVWEYCESVRIRHAGTRALKGGSFGDSDGCRAAYRNLFAAATPRGPDTNRYMNVGFRVCFRPR